MFYIIDRLKFYSESNSMYNQQNVWVSYPNHVYMNIYNIGMNIPNLYDYSAYRQTELEYFSDFNNQEKKSHLTKLDKYVPKINSQIRGFEKFEAFPNCLYADGNDEKELPDYHEYVFQILGGAMIVNEACANVLKQFRLGNSTLTPLKIRDVFSDGVLYSGTVYFFNLCEIREYVKITQSHNDLHYSESGLYPQYYCYGSKFRHNLLEIDKSALECDVDIWHDRTFQSSIFFSDRLRQALIYANMLDKWNMKSCQLV